MKRRDLEGPIQRSIIAYLRQVIPNCIAHHSANEGVRGGTAGYFDGLKARISAWSTRAQKSRVRLSKGSAA